MLCCILLLGLCLPSPYYVLPSRHSIVPWQASTINRLCFWWILHVHLCASLGVLRGRLTLCYCTSKSKSRSSRHLFGRCYYSTAQPALSVLQTQHGGEYSSIHYSSTTV